jgi:hypothetical protein
MSKTTELDSPQTSKWVDVEFFNSMCFVCFLFSLDSISKSPEF